MAVYRKKQPARRPVRRGWKRHARTGMFLFAFALVAVTVGVILPHAGVMSAAAEGSTLTEKIFTTVQNKNLPVIAIDPGHGGTDPGSEGSGLWEYEMTWQVANELVNLLEQDGRYAPVLTIGSLVALWLGWHLSAKKWFTGPKTTIDLPTGVSSADEIGLEHHGRSAHGGQVHEWKQED